MTSLAGVHHAALSVRSLEISVGWYRDVLGLEETFRRDSGSQRVVVLRFPGLRATLGLVEHADASGDFDPRHVGLDHLAFSVDSGDELQAWARRLDELGIAHSGPADTPFGGMLHFNDPDGIALAIFWERAQASAPHSAP
jgi:catechol-2,3-dioxygenase